MNRTGEREPSPSKWLFPDILPETRKARVFCFPYAGGGVATFHDWLKSTPEFIQCYAIQLPGREKRWQEKPFTSVSHLTSTLVRELEPYLDRPFAFFGHSMGALIAFELTRALRRSNAPLPIHMFLAAHRAPHLPLIKRSIYNLPKEEFEEEIRLLQGTDEKVLENRELLEFVTPMLRADLELCETYRFYNEPPLNVPFTVFGGSNDAEVNVSELEPWRGHTNESMDLKMLPGDHFFLRSQKETIVDSIARILSPTHSE